MLNRRGFLKTIGNVAIFALTPLNKLLPRQAYSATKGNSPTGELSAGFLLLSRDAPLPSFVEFPRGLILGHISAEDSSRLDALRGTTAYFGSIEALQADIQLPIFTPSPIFDMTFSQGSVTRYARSGAMWEARYNFVSPNVQQPEITFLVRDIFPHPYPVRPVMDLVKAANVRVGDPEPVIDPEKVDFTPTRGILLPDDDGYTIQWIKQEILYTVLIANQGQRNFAEGFIAALVEK